MGRLNGKVALVTGASRGIGAAIVDAFVEEGATVHAASRSAERGQRDGADWHPLDVADPEAWNSLVAEIIGRHGRIDVLVNNAGIIEYGEVDGLDTAAWDRVVATNQTGTMLGMRAVIPGMRAARSGSIINVSSIWGLAAVAGAHAYHATKGAVANMTKNAAISYATDNVRANSIHPGFTETPLTEAQDADVNAFVISRTPMGRAGRPEEIAAGAVFLASDESSFVTGAELVIDGGYLAQ